MFVLVTIDGLAAGIDSPVAFVIATGLNFWFISWALCCFGRCGWQDRAHVQQQVQVEMQPQTNVHLQVVQPQERQVPLAPKHHHHLLYMPEQAHFTVQQGAGWTIILKRRGNEGLGIAYEIVGNAVLITGVIVPGLVNDWNAHHPSRALLAGDRVVAVNCKFGAGEALRQEIKSSFDSGVVLELLVQSDRRAQQDPLMAPVQQALQEPLPVLQQHAPMEGNQQLELPRLRLQVAASEREAQRQRELRRQRSEEARLAQAQQVLCVICLEGQAVIAIQPCGHRCLCSTCSQTFQQSMRTCPTCRGPVRSMQRIY